jgi:hypothetical protein
MNGWTRHQFFWIVHSCSQRLCRGFVHGAPNQVDSFESHRDRPGPALQQDGGRISPSDRALH